MRGGGGAATSTTSGRPLQSRNGGFSESLLVDAHMRLLEPHEHAFYEGDAQTHIYRIKSGMMRLTAYWRTDAVRSLPFGFRGISSVSGDRKRSFAAPKR